MYESVEMIIRQPGHPDRVVRLREGSTNMGRAEDNDIVLADVGVSRRHARISYARDHVRIEDMGSGNGTYHRGTRVERHNLVDGDEIIIDPFVLRFRVKGGQAGQGAAGDGGDGNARLDVITGAGMARSTYAVGSRGVTLGRSETRDVVVADPASSRHHTTIFPQDGRYVCRDMGSANGTYVNGQRIRETFLSDGDRVRIGNTEFRFVVGDSTKVATGTPTGVGWREHSPDLPADSGWAGESSASVPLTGSGRYSGQQPSLLQTLKPMLLGGVVGLLVLVLVVVILGLAFAIVYSMEGPEQPPARPPHWTLRLSPDVEDEPVATLLVEGVGHMKKREAKEALGQFYQALTKEMGNPSAERLALVAGEFVVLDALEPVLDERVKASAERDELRDTLLARARYRTSAGRRARTQLEEEFRDDPKVKEEREWGPSDAEKELQAKIAEAAALQASGKPVEARRLYLEVLSKASDPVQKSTASSGLDTASRAAARQVQEDWTAGVLAESRGELDLATKHYAMVLAVWPDHPSASIRQSRINLTRPSE